MNTEETRDEKFYKFLLENNLEKEIVKVKDNEWVYKEGYNSHTFDIHNIPIDMSGILYKVYKSALLDGHAEAMRVAKIRFGELFSVPSENY